MDGSLHESEVDPVLDDHLDDAVGVGHQQLDVHLRKPLLEANQQPWKIVLRDRHAGAEHQRAGHVVGQLPKRSVHFTVQREDAPGVLFHPAAGRGQLDAVVLAIEEPGVEMLLELANLERHRRLRHVQPFRRAREAPELRNRVKDLEPPVDHGAAMVGAARSRAGCASVRAETPGIASDAATAGTDRSVRPAARRSVRPANSERLANSPMGGPEACVEHRSGD